MSVELHADDGLEAMLSGRTVDRERPNVSGDLPTVFAAAPMFRRALMGYDRFQVDSYVEWAEDELATADREREHLEARHYRAQSALEEARELLGHSSAGGEFIQTSRRIGAMLAAAADEAESVRVAIEVQQSAACAQAERTVAEAEQVLSDAGAEAGRVLAEATGAANARMAEADRIVDEAEGTLTSARAEAEARLTEMRAMELRTAEDAERLRLRAAEDASAALLHARHEVVRLLGTGREERRRADAAAAAVRERLDQDAVTRRAGLLREVTVLEGRRAALRAEIELLAAQRPVRTDGRVQVRLHRLADKLRSRPRFLRAH